MMADREEAAGNLGVGRESKVGGNHSNDEFLRCLRMKNVYEVLREKEIEVSRVEKEVEALRVVAPLLSEGEEAGADNKPRRATSSAVDATPQPDRAVGSEDRTRGRP
ncbi:MAG: hypothetical protein QOF94_1588 [Acidobacteriaceae bacterium]